MSRLLAHAQDCGNGRPTDVGVPRLQYPVVFLTLQLQTGLANGAQFLQRTATFGLA
jgi:hypothetical protein